MVAGQIQNLLSADFRKEGTGYERRKKQVDTTTEIKKFRDEKSGDQKKPMRM